MVEYSNKNVKKLKEDIYTAMKDSGGNEPGEVGYVGPTVQLAIPTTGGHGRKTITTAGTPEQLTETSTTCKRVIIQADRGNTGYIAVGYDDTIDTATGSEEGDILESGDSTVINIDNVNKIYIDSSVSGEGVHYRYEV
jgi:hypothetical protein